MIKEVVRKSMQFYQPVLDLQALCQELGILLLPHSFGVNGMKGFYLKSNNIKSITYNCDLPEMMQKIVIAHELGHALLHDGDSLHTYHDICVSHLVSKLEREANLFAADLLLGDEDVLEKLKEKTYYQTAAELSVPVELLCCKLDALRIKGYQIPETSDFAKARWLGGDIVNRCGTHIPDSASAEVST